MKQLSDQVYLVNKFIRNLNCTESILKLVSMFISVYKTQHLFTYLPLQKYMYLTRSLRSFVVKSILKPTKFKYCLYGCRFLFQAHKLWNTLPKYVRDSETIEILNNNLKHHLFTMYLINMFFNFQLSILGVSLECTESVCWMSLHL